MAYGVFWVVMLNFPNLPGLIAREAPEEFDDTVTITMSYELNDQGFPVKITRLVEHEVYEDKVWEDSFEYSCN